jgi:hypothetical protein
MQSTGADRSTESRAGVAWPDIAGMAVSCAIVVAGLYLRSPEQFRSPQFWSEDASGLFVDARAHGWSSVFLPYAGYLQVLLRAVAATANVIGAMHSPTLYWLCSVVFAAAPALVGWQVLRDLPQWSRWCLAAATVFVPHPGVDFNNLLNSQWMLGAALALTLLWRRSSSRPAEVVICISVFILGLQGPFCLIYCPLLFLRWLWYRDLTSSVWYYVAWIVPVLAQLACVIASPRLGGMPLSEALMRPLGEMARAYVWNYFGLFGGGAVLSGALLMWLGTLLYFTCFCATDRPPRGESLYRVTAMLAAGAFILISASLSFADLRLLHPFNGHARYFYIPYVLLTVCYLALAKTHVEIAVTAILIGCTQYLQFSPAGLQDYSWSSYVRLARTVGPVSVPINPQIESMPGAYDIRLAEEPSSHRLIFATDLPAATGLTGVRWTHQERRVISTHIPQVSLAANTPTGAVFVFEGIPSAARDIALKVNLNAKNAGWINLYFSSVQGRSLPVLRYFPAGDQVVYLARPSLGASFNLRLEICERAGIEVSGLQLIGF